MASKVSYQFNLGLYSLNVHYHWKVRILYVYKIFPGCSVLKYTAFVLIVPRCHLCTIPKISSYTLPCCNSTTYVQSVHTILLQITNRLAESNLMIRLSHQRVPSKLLSTALPKPRHLLHRRQLLPHEENHHGF